MGRPRVWLFRGLVIVAAGLMLLSWFMPWWSADVLYFFLEKAIVIHPYGLEVCPVEEIAGVIPGAEMPAWFAPLMWAYLGVCLLSLLSSLFVGEKEFSLSKRRYKKAKLLIGGVGLSYIVVVVLAVIIAAIRTGDFWGLRLQGYTFISLGYPMESDLYARLLLGYWLACAVGPLLIVLALLRNKVIGKPKLRA